MRFGTTPDGDAVELIRLAPLGDPMEVRVRGYLLSIRKENARHVRLNAPGS